MSDLQKKVRKGNDAARILDNRVFNEAFAFIDATLTEKWKATKAMDKEAREIIYTQQQCLQQVRKYFEIAVTHGKLAARKLEELEHGERSTGP